MNIIINHLQNYHSIQLHTLKYVMLVEVIETVTMFLSTKVKMMCTFLV